MTTVGIVGGLGPESTIDYYRRILRAWERVDPSSAPAVVIDSLDVRAALRLVQHDRSALTDYLMRSLRRLAGAGVDFAAMSANTPHIVFDALAERSPIPLLSIVEVCAQEARRLGLTRPALLGTRFTMEEPFYADAFARQGIAVVVPNQAERLWVHERYVEELLRGEFRDQTRAQFLSLVGRLVQDEAIDGVILGGTELPLLLPEAIIAGVPVLDTTALHVAAIVERLRAEEPLKLAGHRGEADGGEEEGDQSRAGTAAALLRHFLAALAYRTQKALRGAPDSFGSFDAGRQTRTPAELIRHMTSVLGYARTFFLGGQYRPEPLPDLAAEVARFHALVEDLGRHLDAGTELRGITADRLLQGPFADAMTHAGQLAMLRRLAGWPVAPENFIVANIDAANLGPVQSDPVSPDAVWPEGPRADGSA